jgi:hypothetical protein
LESTSVKSGFKAFWSRKEGKPTIIVAGLALVAFVMFGLPAIISFVTSLLHLGIVAVAALLVYWVLVDDELRTKFWYLYKAFIRAVFSWFMNLSPEAILKSHIAYLHKQMDIFIENLKGLRGQKKTIEMEIANLYEEIEQKRNLALAANKKQETKTQAVMYAAQVKTLEDSVKKYEAQNSRLGWLIKVFDRAREANNLAIQQTEFKIKNLIRDKEIGAKTNSLVSSSMKVLFGSTASREIYEQATAKMQDEIAQQQGALDQFMGDVQPLMTEMDIQKGMDEETGKKLLEEWDQKLPALLGVSSDQIKIEGVGPAAIYEVIAPAKEYSKVFKTKS